MKSDGAWPTYSLLQDLAPGDLQPHYFFGINLLDLDTGDENKFTICKRQSDRMGFKLTKWKAVDGNSVENYSAWSNYMSEPWTEQDIRLNRKSIDQYKKILN